jgi:hypothetical protein
VYALVPGLLREEVRIRYLEALSFISFSYLIYYDRVLVCAFEGLLDLKLNFQ